MKTMFTFPTDRIAFFLFIKTNYGLSRLIFPFQKEFNLSFSQYAVVGCGNQKIYSRHKKKNNYSQEYKAHLKFHLSITNTYAQ